MADKKRGRQKIKPSSEFSVKNASKPNKSIDKSFTDIWYPKGSGKTDESYCNGREIYLECSICRERKWCNLKYVPDGKIRTPINPNCEVD